MSRSAASLLLLGVLGCTRHVSGTGVRQLRNHEVTIQTRTHGEVTAIAEVDPGDPAGIYFRLPDGQRLHASTVLRAERVDRGRGGAQGLGSHTIYEPARTPTVTLNGPPGSVAGVSIDFALP